MLLYLNSRVVTTSSEKVRKEKENLFVKKIESITTTFDKIVHNKTSDFPISTTYSFKDSISHNAVKKKISPLIWSHDAMCNWIGESVGTFRFQEKRESEFEQFLLWGWDKTEQSGSKRRDPTRLNEKRQQQQKTKNPCQHRAQKEMKEWTRHET